MKCRISYLDIVQNRFLKFQIKVVGNLDIPYIKKKDPSIFFSFFFCIKCKGH